MHAGDGGFDTLEVAFSDSWALAEEVASYGAAVVVLDPPDLREAVVRRLQAVAAGGRLRWRRRATSWPGC